MLQHCGPFVEKLWIQIFINIWMLDVVCWFHSTMSVLHCVAVCCSVLQWAAVCCSVLQCVAVCCSVLQCVAVCCSVDVGPTQR